MPNKITLVTRAMNKKGKLEYREFDNADALNAFLERNAIRLARATRSKDRGKRL
jgi:hypothetical protein